VASPRSSERRAQESGLALVLCLLVLTILIILITQFAYSVKVEEKVARNSKDDVKALFAARGALAYVRAFLREDRRKESPADSLREDWASEKLSAVRVGDAEVHMKVEDCDRALNVNLLADESTKDFAKGVLERLCARLEIDDAAAVAARIADYIDRDAEGDYETGAKNGPIAHVDELLEIRDIPAEAFFGGPAARATANDPNAQPKRGLFAPEPLLTAWGSKKININTAPNDLLWAMIPEAVGGKPFTSEQRDQAVQKIVDYRAGTDSSGTGAGARTGTGNATEALPGNDFEKVDDLGRVVPDLAPLLRAQAAPAGGSTGGGDQPGGGDGKAAVKAKPFRDMIGVSALDYRITIDVSVGTTSAAAYQAHYEAILRRGTDAFDTLLWREVPR
jgi:general secretion pathway protein K